ncbi:6243_t:CDS:1, partial [Funneliformis geosporum]
PLTPKTRGAIVYGHNCGQSSRTIAKRLGCGKSTINDILNRLHETYSLTPKKQSGRPPLLNSPAQQELKAFVQENGENRRLCSKKLATVWTAYTKQPISA